MFQHKHTDHDEQMFQHKHTDHDVQNDQHKHTDHDVQKDKHNHTDQDVQRDQHKHTDQDVQRDQHKHTDHDVQKDQHKHTDHDMQRRVVDGLKEGLKDQHKHTDHDVQMDQHKHTDHDVQRRVVDGLEEGLWWLQGADHHRLHNLPWTLLLLLLHLGLRHGPDVLGYHGIHAHAGPDWQRSRGLRQHDDLILGPCAQWLDQARRHVATGGCVNVVGLVA